jgi:hypothetical protein
MPTTISDLRDGIATNLATITGLRTSAEVPDNPSPPIAIVQLQRVAFDGAFQGGMTTYEFLVSVVVGRVAEREAQRRLDAFASTSGDASIKAAIESDRTLDGECFDLRVSEMQNIGAVLLGEASYLAADFAVTVYAE